MFRLISVILAFFALERACLAEEFFELTPETVPLAETENGVEWLQGGMERALASGFRGIAETMALQLLELNPPAPVQERASNVLLQLDLTRGAMSAAAGRIESMKASGVTVDPLLEAYFFFFEERFAEVDAFLEEVDAGNREYEGETAAWLALLRGLRFADLGLEAEAEAAFLLAERLAGTGPLRNHFELIRIHESLRKGPVSPESISALRETERSMRGERGGVEAARLLALALARNTDREGAIGILTSQLALPVLDQVGARDSFLFLLANLSGPESTRGRLALREILETGQDPETLALAFSQLVRSQLGVEALEALNADISRWIERVNPPHPLKEQLLAYGTYLAAKLGNSSLATQWASRFTADFPDSPLMEQVLWTQAQLAWNGVPPRYRTAADYLNQIQQRFYPDGGSMDHQRLQLLIGDCFFLNGDTGSAAEAYAAVRRVAAGTFLSRAFFQEILTRINREEWALISDILDAAYTNPAIDPEILWKAEWNFLEALRSSGLQALARERVGTRLDILNTLEDNSLLLRFRWIEVQLALDAGEAEEVLSLIPALLLELEEGRFQELDAALIDAVSAHLFLKEGQAAFLSGDPSAAIEAFTRLRETYPESGPAILSYLVESRNQAGSDDPEVTQESLLSLVEQFPESEYAPLALWEAALTAEKRGLNSQFREAISFLERLAVDYPQHPLVFNARLKQGDLARQLNDFATALLLYDQMLRQFPEHPDRLNAEISRADCLMALGSDDALSLDQAAGLYERIAILPVSPPALRIEAGYKWSQALRQQGEFEAMRSALWLMLERILSDVDFRESLLLSENGSYWAARVLLDLAQSLRSTEEPQRAIELYQTFLLLNLPGRNLAQAQLEALSRELGIGL
jgi:outer membrane protein assembly factor BamD (BamD/ComL family)